MRSTSASALGLALVLLAAGCQTLPEVAAPAATPPPKVTPAVEASYRRALALMRAGRDKQALAALRKLAAEQPGLAGPRLNLGILYLRLNRLKEAEAALSEAARLNPGNAAVHNQLGILYRRLGRFAEARDAYRKALAINPNYARAHRNLGILYDLYLGELGRALEHYRRYQALTRGADKEVAKWIVDLERRVAARAANGGQEG